MKHFLLLVFVLFFASCSKTTESSGSESTTTESNLNDSENSGKDSGDAVKGTNGDATDNTRSAGDTPEGFPFGLSLDELKQEKGKEYGGGDCWGILINYTGDNVRLVVDSSSCGDYGSNVRYYFFGADRLEKVHIKESNVDFEAKDGEGNYIGTEKIYNFKAVPPVSFTRTERLGQPDFTSLSTVYKVEKIKDAEATIEQLEKELRASEGPVVHHYICYTEDNGASPNLMIAFDEDGRAISARYEGQEGALELEYLSEDFETGTAYPTLEEHYREWVGEEDNGHYKLTHQGNWDYAEYKRAKDGKVFQFTIDHDRSIVGDSYAEAPCF